MTREEALNFWFGRINYEQRAPKPSDLKLDRMRALLRLLGEPQQSFRILHVAGSKGKGSTSAMLAAVLSQAGYRTGLFTSPHLCDVTERIQVNGQCLHPQELTALMDDVRPAVEFLDRLARGPGDRPTFFEIATALGFLHFARRRVELAVVEVGLGGRFDSTNVCTPLVAIITSISYDHTHILGDRLEQIAREKAGIVKAGRPTISGVTAEEARRVIEATCQQCRSPLRQLGRDFDYDYEPGFVDRRSERRSRLRVRTRERTWPWLELALLGEHQARNAAVVVAVIEQLRREGLVVPDTAVAAGLAAARWPARVEVVGRRPLTILDCAHNVASAQALVETLTASFPPTRRLLVFACSSDKDIRGILRELAPAFSAFWVTCYSHNPRAIPPEQLASILRELTPRPVTVCPAALDAWQAAQAAAGPDDLVCITGSVYLAGELRPWLVSDADQGPAGSEASRPAASQSV
ncbi:MAG: bifunctional folylpolyglutamate synthase/dihydrofolate synthase [Gemmataceae bacterium]|nr:bifunctional folylpolyglutamate synthase/dihydrofolate synthase [Gemmataceae bacterium]MDW8265538.1 folylpolyglutamate synthase/dihydrofolate synthase family protein [Gemmataceae bacterium]